MSIPIALTLEADNQEFRNNSPKNECKKEDIKGNGFLNC